MKDSDTVFLFCRTVDDKRIRIPHQPFGESAALLASMIQNVTALDSERQARRLNGDELALIRDTLRSGKHLSVAAGEAVWFEPLITFTPACAVEG